MDIKPYQKEIFDIFKNEFKDRIKNEEPIKEIITECSNLISEMKNKNEVDLTQRFADYLNNISLSMDMLEKYRPSNVSKINKNFILLALIQYAYYCENLVTLFDKFIIANTIYNSVLLKDIKKELEKSKRKMLRYSEVKNLAFTKKKTEENLFITDFLTAISSKYSNYYKTIFKGRIIPHLRNAIAHNKFSLDETNQIIKGVYNPYKKQKENIPFLRFIDLHDTIVMIYFCIVKELTR